MAGDEAVPLPATISPEAKAVIRIPRKHRLQAAEGPGALMTSHGWKALHDAQEKALEEPNRAVLSQTGATVTEDTHRRHSRPRHPPQGLDG